MGCDCWYCNDPNQKVYLVPPREEVAESDAVDDDPRFLSMVVARRARQWWKVSAPPSPARKAAWWSRMVGPYVGQAMHGLGYESHRALRRPSDDEVLVDPWV